MCWYYMLKMVVMLWVIQIHQIIIFFFFKFIRLKHFARKWSCGASWLRRLGCQHAIGLSQVFQNWLWKFFMHISSIIWIVSGVSNSVFCLFWECTVHIKLPGMYLRRLWTWFSMRSSHFASLRSTRCGQSGSRESKIYSIKCWAKVQQLWVKEKG